MNALKKSTLWVVDSYRYLMDIRYNPLRHIPDPSLQSYFTLVLFTMWSAYFGLVWSYHLGWYGYDVVLSIFLHVGVLIPIMITNGVFIDAERANAPWIKQWRELKWKKK